MRNSGKSLGIAASLLLAMSLLPASARAEIGDFWEGLFGVQARRTEAANSGARVAPSRSQPPRAAALLPPRAGAARPEEIPFIRFRIRNQGEVRIIHSGGDETADAKIQDYLRSPAFTRRFSANTDVADASTREKVETEKMAIAYLLRHDATLRPGDALVTREGVLVFDGEKRDFVPVSVGGSLGGSLRDQLPVAGARAAKAEPAPQPELQAALDVASPRLDIPLAFSTRVKDGQPIRFVVGTSIRQ